MSLANADLLVGFDNSLRQDKSLERRLQRCGLLYPHPSALDLSQLSIGQRPQELVVLDGTWSHARGMYRKIPALQELPHYTLPASKVSGFEIRKQPAAHCLSTIEAICFALQALEPETPGLDTMLRPFRAMQSQQLVAMQPHVPRIKKPSTHRARRSLAGRLARRFDSLVVVYGESSTVGASERPRHLLTFAAERPASGQKLRLVLEQHAQHERHLPYMRLSQSDLAQAISGPKLQTLWQDFSRPDDLVAAWSAGTLDLLRSELPGLEQSMLLKAAYFDLNRPPGSLEEVVVREGLLSNKELMHNQESLSRTEERMQSALALASYLHGIGGAPIEIQSSATTGS